MKRNSENSNKNIKIYFDNYTLEEIINKDTSNNIVFAKAKAKNQGNYHTGHLDNRLNRSAHNNVLIIKDKITNKKYIQKILPEGKYDKTIFDYLYNNPIKNIPKIISMKRIDGRLVIIKEYIEGITLSKYLENNNSKSKDIFYNLLYKLCDILASLHNAPVPIIHRDIKPDNIIIDSNGNPYIIDLNSTVFFNPEKSADSIKLGTEGYAAPEQYGFAASNPATDIYAMGCLMKYIIPFFNDKNLETKMNPIIDKCCKIDFTDRYKNMSELKKEIYKSERNYRLLAIPGYRNFNINHMIIASIFYILIFYYCFLNNDNSFKLNLLTFSFIIIVIFTLFNYLGVHRIMPLTKNKNKFTKIIGILLLTIIVATIMIFVCFYIY